MFDKKFSFSIKSLSIFCGIEIFSFCSLPPYIIAGTLPLALRDLTSPFDLVFLILASSEFIKTWIFNTCFQ